MNHAGAGDANPRRPRWERTWRLLLSVVLRHASVVSLAFGPSRCVDFKIDFAFGLQPITQLCAVLSSSSLVDLVGTSGDSVHPGLVRMRHRRHGAASIVALIFAGPL